MHTRRLLSSALAVAGAVLLFAGGLTLYLRAEVFDARAFGDRATSALEDEHVRTVVSKEVVTGLIERADSDLIQARPLLESVIAGALDTGAFKSVFRKAAEQTHNLLFEREKGSVVLDLADAGVVAVSAVKAVAPAVAQKIPEDVEPGLIKLSERSFATRFLNAAETIRGLGLILPILALLCLIGSILVAVGDRRAAIARAGGALAATGALLVIALLAMKAIVVSQAGGDADLRGAVGAAWDSFFGDLRTWALAVGGLGVVLAASASTVLEQEDVTSAAARARELLERTPTSRLGRLARAAIVIAASLIVVIQPTYAVQIAAVLLGAFGLFFGMTEVLQVISPRRSGPSPLRRIRRPRLRALTPREGLGLIAGALALMIVLAVARSVVGGAEEPPPPGDPEPVACNGFAELCPRPLNQVAFAASHNSMSAADRPGWLLANHTGGMTEQLRYGIRGLLIDAHYGVRNAKERVRTDLDREGRNKANVVREQLGPEAIAAAERLIGERLGQGDLTGKRGTYLCHTLCELGSQPLADGLAEVTRFLDAHPDEVVIVFIEDYVAAADIAAGFRESGLDRYVYEHDRESPWPSLGKMIEDGTRVLVMAENDETNDPPWYHTGFALTQETPYDFKAVDELRSPESCRHNRGSVNSPLFLLNHFVEKFPLSPKLSERVNGREVLERRAELCKEERSLQPNLIAVDFYDRGNVLETVNVLNGLPPGAKAALPTRRP